MIEIAQSIMDLEGLKEYVNNTQSIPDPNQFILGFRFGIILAEISKIQDSLSSIQREAKKEDTK